MKFHTIAVSIAVALTPLSLFAENAHENSANKIAAEPIAIHKLKRTDQIPTTFAVSGAPTQHPAQHLEPASNASTDSATEEKIQNAVAKVTAPAKAKIRSDVLSQLASRVSDSRS